MTESQEQQTHSHASKRTRSAPWQTVVAWIALTAAGILAIGAGGYWIYQERDGGPGVEIIIPTPAPVIVHVTGAVTSPGVYELRRGSRVDDLLEAAGGTHADASLDHLNLARVLNDGERVDVPRLGDSEITSGGLSSTGGSTSSSGQSAGLLDLNTASKATLETLPGIGSARADLIIAYRQEHGPIMRVDDLLAISGIGPATVESIRGLVIQP